MSGRKLTKRDAAYMFPSPIPGHCCGNCTAMQPVEYVQAPPQGEWAGSCQRVEGEVHSGGWCKVWTIRYGDPIP